MELYLFILKYVHTQHFVNVDPPTRVILNEYVCPYRLGFFHCTQKTLLEGRDVYVQICKIKNKLCFIHLSGCLCCSFSWVSSFEWTWEVQWECATTSQCDSITAVSVVTWAQPVFVTGPQADLFAGEWENMLKVEFCQGLMSKWTGNDDRLWYLKSIMT